MDIPMLKAFLEVEFGKDFDIRINKEWNCLQIKKNING